MPWEAYGLFGYGKYEKRPSQIEVHYVLRIQPANHERTVSALVCTSIRHKTLLKLIWIISTCLHIWRCRTESIWSQNIDPPIGRSHQVRMISSGDPLFGLNIGYSVPCMCNMPSSIDKLQQNISSATKLSRLKYVGNSAQQLFLQVHHLARVHAHQPPSHWTCLTWGVFRL